MAYQLEGGLLEVCTCNILCRAGSVRTRTEGTCDGVLSWHIDSGQVNGTDVSGRTIAVLAHPREHPRGNWRVVVYVDDKASDDQQQALLDVWTGKLGGPMGDLSQLIGEVLAVEQAPVEFQVEGKGSPVASRSGRRSTPSSSRSPARPASRARSTTASSRRSRARRHTWARQRRIRSQSRSTARST